MTLNIRASVVDLRRDAPQPADHFLVDSNVWVWLGYSKASMSGRPYQTHEYPNYIAKIAAAGGKIRRSAFALAEAAHVIEKKEYEIFEKKTSAGTRVKEFRHDFPAERVAVIAEIQAMWGVVKSVSANIVVGTTESFIDGALAEIAAAEVDAYDGFLVRLARQFSLTGIITDDADLATAAGMTIFTANRTTISEAKAQGHLMTR